MIMSSVDVRAGVVPDFIEDSLLGDFSLGS